MFASRVVLASVLGLCVGSFLNVVIERVPRRASVLRPASSCPACDAELQRRDLVPVVSWIVLRRRCRTCGIAISARYPVVELITAALFAAVAATFGEPARIVAYCLLAAGCVALGAIDLDTHTLPTRVVVVMSIGGLGTLTMASAIERSPGRLVGAAIGAAAVGGAFFAVWWLVPDGFGFGDVRYGTALGMFLGWLGMRPVFAALIVAFGAGSVGGLAMVALRRADRHSALPLGPALSLGAQIAVLISPIWR